MPNHCENDLYIKPSWSGGFDDAAKAAERATVQEVLDFLGAEGEQPTFDFGKLIPYPAEWAAMDADYHALGEWGTDEFHANREAYQSKWHTDKDGYNSGGYEWCIDNWGTKWNAYEVARRDFDGDVIVSFKTAWSPPLPVIAALAERFPHMNFVLEYFEMGVGFYGGVRYTDVDSVAKYSDEPRVVEWRGEYKGTRGG